MPRITRTRKRPGDIASAPVLLGTTDQVERQLTKKEKKKDKREKWLAKLDTAQTKRRQERKAPKSVLLQGLGALKESLGQVDVRPEEKKPSSLSTKARGRVAKEEEERFGLILKHPAFRADPLGTIRQHLQNSQAGSKNQGD
ncbi:hypothetical protein GGF46_003594 [Coemansia sp. RSA 552]|nr:hypothetical protein GGF46_003594 [Coemansia sp. RSA 552]